MALTEISLFKKRNFPISKIGNFAAGSQGGGLASDAGWESADARRKVRLFPAGVAESAFAALAFLKFPHDAELGLNHWHEYHLGNAVTGLNRE